MSNNTYGPSFTFPLKKDFSLRWGRPLRWVFYGVMLWLVLTAPEIESKKVLITLVAGLGWAYLLGRADASRASNQ